MQSTPFTIPAECHSDDYISVATFEALPWFEQASDAELLALHACMFGGDYAADVVAEFMETESTDVSAMFAYIRSMRGQRNAPGFECHVQPFPALEWLRANRVHVYDQIQEANVFFAG